MTHPEIRQAVVIASEELAANKSLAAYVVGESESTPSSNTLRQYLLSKLPEYMVPSLFVSLECLPLTPNGKVDRKALPLPDGQEREIEYVAPRTFKEGLLAQIWSKVIGVEIVGIYDNFFELGGHSLMVVSLMSEIKREFQTNISLATIFQSPTIEKLAVVIDYDSSIKQWSALVPIQTEGSLIPIFCVPGIGSNGFYFYHLSRYLGKNQPLYSFQSQGLN